MKHTISLIYKSLADVIQTAIDTVATTGQQAIETDIPLAASGTPIANHFGVAIGKIKSICMISDVDCTLTLKDAANSTLATVTLTGGAAPFVVYEGQQPAVDLTDLWADDVIATISVVNTSSPLAAGTLKIRILADPS